MEGVCMQTRRRLVRVLILTLAILFGVTLPARAEKGAPRAAVDATTHDFGRVSRGTVVTKRFVIRNTGTAPLLIESMQFSTPGMRARVASTIEPGASAQLEIVWDTSHYTRDAEGQAILLLNDPDLPKLVLTLTGFVVSPIDVEPVPAFYLSQFQGEVSSQTVTIRNNRDRTVQITGTERKGESFTLAVETVEPGRVYAVTATASPDVTPGEYRESALVFTDDPERPKIRLDVNLLVKRDVHASVDVIDMGQVRIAPIRANPSLLDLLRQTVILESRSADMRITKIESDLPFVTLQYEPEGPAKRVRIDVGLDPKKLSAGEHSGSVRIHTSLKAVPLVTLPIKMTVAN
jgi:Protein of unknown function (DUF1573)